MTPQPPLQVEWHDRVCRLLLNRPAQGNALSAGLVAALDDALADAARRAATLLVLEGAGRHFCTGFDLSALETETDDSLLARFTRIELLLQRLHRMPCPTVAVVRGRAMGAGADLFVACDHRLVREGSAFAFPGFNGFGLVLGTRRLGSRVGQSRALDWVKSGRLVDSTEALETGLATGQTDASDALSAAQAAANSAASGKMLTAALDGDDARDLVALVRSAAPPGMRDRVASYLAHHTRARKAAADA